MVVSTGIYIYYKGWGWGYATVCAVLSHAAADRKTNLIARYEDEEWRWERLWYWRWCGRRRETRMED